MYPPPKNKIKVEKKKKKSGYLESLKLSVERKRSII